MVLNLGILSWTLSEWKAGSSVYQVQKSSSKPATGGWLAPAE